MLELAHGLGAEPCDAPDRGGRSPLSWAAQGNRATSIAWLLEHGVDPNRADSRGWGPIHFAAADGHLDALRSLLSAGATLARLPSGHLPSDLARGFAPQQAEALALLLDAEAAVAE